MAVGTDHGHRLSSPPRGGLRTWWVRLTGPVGPPARPGGQTEEIAGGFLAYSRHPATSLDSFLLTRIGDDDTAAWRYTPTLESTEYHSLKVHSQQFRAYFTPLRLLSRYGSICRGSRDGDGCGDNGGHNDPSTANTKSLHSHFVHFDVLPWLMLSICFFCICRRPSSDAGPRDDAYFRSTASLATKLSRSTRSGVERH